MTDVRAAVATFLSYHTVNIVVMFLFFFYQQIKSINQSINFRTSSHFTVKSAENR